MTLKLNKRTFVAAIVCVTLSACSSNDDNGTGTDAIDGGDGMTVDVVDTEDMEGDSPSDVTGPTGDFAFSDVAFEDYTRVDRSGMPAIATALIESDDAYNAANPTDDVAGSFVPEIVASLNFVHGALDSQLMDLGLTPCTVEDGTGTCVQFAAPLIIPDTMSINTENPAGFPNGRMLADPVIAVTLAVALLELTGDPAPHTAVDLVGVVNPPANDLEFNTEFPFLADPQ